MIFLKVDVVTLFPSMFEGPFGESIVGRARASRIVEINVIDLRDYTHDRHKVTDDEPYGGGPGMVMKPEPLVEAVEDLRQEGSVVILMCPQGSPFTQPVAKALSRNSHLVILCGHYGGIDDRVRQVVDEEISLGDFILTGGEIPAMAVVDAVVRLVSGVLGDEGSLKQDSFAEGLLEGPQYTRPREYRGMAVPDVLMSGNHEAIRLWRRKEGLRRTWQRRPELLEQASLNDEDKALLKQIHDEYGGLEPLRR